MTPAETTLDASLPAVPSDCRRKMQATSATNKPSSFLSADCRQHVSVVPAADAKWEASSLNTARGLLLLLMLLLAAARTTSCTGFGWYRPCRSR